MMKIERDNTNKKNHFSSSSTMNEYDIEVFGEEIVNSDFLALFFLALFLVCKLSFFLTSAKKYFMLTFQIEISLIWSKFIYLLIYLFEYFKLCRFIEVSTIYYCNLKN